MTDTQRNGVNVREKWLFLKNFFRHRQHPVKILTYTFKYIWLMIIPLGKYLIATRFDFQNWIKANWLDILIIILIFAFAFLKWVFVYYEMEEDGIVAHSGPFGLLETKIYFNEITTFSCTKGVFYGMVKACTMYIETSAQSLPQADINLVLSQKCVREIYNTVTAQCRHLPKFSVSPKKSHLLVFSFLFSSTLSGMILFATFMFEVYRLVGKELEEQLFMKVNGEISRLDSRFLRLSDTIPRIILVLAGVVLGGWLLSFITNIMRHWSFTATRCGGQYIIKSGILVKRRHVMNRKMINCLDIQQTLLMKLFRISSVTLYCPGYGTRRREISALIPITTNKTMSASVKILSPGLHIPKTEIRTGKKDLMRFIMLPIIFCFIPAVAGSFAKLLVDKWHTEINILMAVSVIPLVWLAIVQFNACFSTGMGFNGGYMSVVYCTGYQFHRLVVPKKNISKLAVSRNIFQRVNGTCTLYVYTTEKKIKRHRIKSLPFNKVHAICQREGFRITTL